jgi:hypothetical protein
MEENCKWKLDSFSLLALFYWGECAGNSFCPTVWFFLGNSAIFEVKIEKEKCAQLGHSQYPNPSLICHLSNSTKKHRNDKAQFDTN